MGLTLLSAGALGAHLIGAAGVGVLWPEDRRARWTLLGTFLCGSGAHA